jgi:hypothetical protein
MNQALEEYILEQLDKFKEQDVIIYYDGKIKLTYGFFVWNGYSHTETTIAELLKDGFEKRDIKELRSEAKRITIIEGSFNQFEVKNVEQN